MSDEASEQDNEDASSTEATYDPRSVADALDAVIAGGRAAQIMSLSVSLFEAGGKSLLREGTRALVRSVAERRAQDAFGYAVGPLLGPTSLASTSSMLSAAVDTAASAAPLAARMAAKEVLKGAGRAGGFGLVVDGAVASLDAVVAIRDGSMDKKSASLHVMKEAATGALATGAGVLLGAGMVALTGGAAGTLVFAIGAFGAMGTKGLLRRLTR
jgi:hypothetical protein